MSEYEHEAMLLLLTAAYFSAVIIDVTHTRLSTLHKYVIKSVPCNIHNRLKSDTLTVRLQALRIPSYEEFLLYLRIILMRSMLFRQSESVDFKELIM